MNPKILIIGGTGMLGLPVARKMKEDGFEVTILTTDVDRARARLGGEFNLVSGDVRQIDTLREPFNGQDFVYLNLNANLDPVLYQEIEINGTANASRVARESGVKRIGMISGASSQGKEEGVVFLDGKVRAERAMMESGVPFTIMRASWFFESLPRFIQGRRAGVLGQQPTPRGWLAAADYARQVSRAFQIDEAANKCFYNLGPQRLIVMSVLKEFCARHYPHLKPITVPFWLARVASLRPGQEMLRKAIPFFKYHDTHGPESSPDETDRTLGPNLTTLEEWLETYRPPHAADN